MGNCIFHCCPEKNRNNVSHRYLKTSHATKFDQQKVSKLNSISTTGGGGDSLGFINAVKEIPTEKSKSPFPNELDQEKLLTQLFDNYKDSDDFNIISAAGCEQLCIDLNFKPDDFQVLVLAYYLNASTMAVFTKEEFITGLKNLNLFSLDDIKFKVPNLVHEVLNDKKQFKSFYYWAFQYTLDDERSLNLEIAIALWQIVFSQNQPAILKRWLFFLEKNPNIKCIAKDTWLMFLNLTEQIGNDLSNYDESEAWPSLFDDFVEWENDRQNQNVTD